MNRRKLNQKSKPKEKIYINVLNTLQNRLNENQLRLNSINREKGVSSWLTSYPINNHGLQNLLSNVCNDVDIEPKLLPVTGENFSNGTANTCTGSKT